MKKVTILQLASILLMGVLLYVGCSKNGNLQNKNVAVKIAPVKNAVLTLIRTVGPYSCGSYISGYSDTPVGAHSYPDATLNFGGVANGSSIKLVCDPLQIPNRFTIYNGATQVATTGWIGVANFSGPWGSSLNVPGPATITFSKTVNSYTLHVETSTPADSTDTYQINVYCIGGDSSCGTPPCPDSICACGKVISDSYNTISSYHFYPDKPINLNCRQTGDSISIYCDPVSVPNRFTVYDGNGTFVVTSGWVGLAKYSGSWGFADNTHPFSKPPTTIWFTKGSTSNYILRVETQTPPNNTYSPTTDDFHATLTCH